MANYFQLRTGLSRKDCTYQVEYFMLDIGMLSSVTICEDKHMWRSPAAPFGVPAAAVPCEAADYEAARIFDVFFQLVF